MPLFSRFRESVRNLVLTRDRWDAHLLACIGQIAIEWAAIELWLDIVIEWLHHSGGHEEIQDDLPRSFRPKLAYLRRATALGILPEDFREQSVKLRRELKRLSIKRNRLIHSLASTYHRPTGGWRFHRSKISGSVREIETTIVKSNEPVELLWEIYNAGGTTRAFSRAVTAHFSAQFTGDSKN